MQHDVEIDRIDEIAGRTIVLEQNRAWRLGFHVGSDRSERNGRGRFLPS
jgi:hypothetical protein